MNRERLENLLDDWARGRLPSEEAQAVDAALEANPEWAEEARAHRRALQVLGEPVKAIAPEGLLAAALVRGRSGEDPIAAAGLDPSFLDDEPGIVEISPPPPAQTGPEAVRPAAAVIDAPPPKRQYRRWVYTAAAAVLVAGAGITAWQIQPDRGPAPATEAAPTFGITMNQLSGDAPTAPPRAAGEGADALQDRTGAEALVAGDVLDEDDAEAKSSVASVDPTELAERTVRDEVAAATAVAESDAPRERRMAQNEPHVAEEAPEPETATFYQFRDNRQEQLGQALAASAPKDDRPDVSASRSDDMELNFEEKEESVAMGLPGQTRGVDSAVPPPAPVAVPPRAQKLGREMDTITRSLTAAPPARFDEASALALAASFTPSPESAGPPAPAASPDIPAPELEHILVQAAHAGGRLAPDAADALESGSGRQGAWRFENASADQGVTQLGLQFDSLADYEAFLLNLRMVPMIRSEPLPVTVSNEAGGVRTSKPNGAGRATAVTRNGLVSSLRSAPASAISNAAGAALVTVASQLARFDLDAYTFNAQREPTTGAILVRVAPRPS